MWHFKKAGLFGMPFGKESSMETKMMKKSKISLWKWALSACLLFAGVQNAFALGCDGTIYIQVPSSWTMVTLEAGGMFPKLSVGTSGWYEAKAASVGQGTTFRVNSAGTHYPAQWIDRNHYDIANNESTADDAFTCADLATGTLYIYEDPTTPGKTVFTPDPPNAKYFFVMIPPDMEEWMSSVPMISLDGGVTGKPMTAVADMCGWYSYVFFNETITDNVVLYRDDDEERIDMIGLFGNAEDDATPIPLGMTFDYMAAAGQDTLFFVPDEEQKTNDDGFYYTAAEVDGIEGTCEYTMAAIIYDSDASLHPAFSCFGDKKKDDKTECQQGALGVTATAARAAIDYCVGVHTGIVNPTLDPNVPQKMKKPTLNTSGVNGPKCFINETLFNQLFNYSQGVNEKSCYNMPFHRSDDGKWEFDSDFYVSAGTSVPGGFYPVEFPQDETGDAIILAADPTQTPVRAARRKHAAEGAIFYGPELREVDPVEGAPLIDLLCKGPGWSKGEDCEGLFADGDGTDAFFKANVTGFTCGFGWSCPDKAPKGWTFYTDNTEKTSTLDTKVPRWTANTTDYVTGGRNQQYCFESHAKFTHKPGLKFNFRGDDDIWVFIDNKIAVDLGGTHLAAPGYVDLDNFEGLSGKLEVGNQYDIDIFFCDRRTTMSNVRIKTNMYIQQKVDIQVKGKKNPQNPAEKIFELCYTKSGDGSCASAGSETEQEVKCCGSDFTNPARPECMAIAPAFFLVNGKKPSDPIKQMRGANGTFVDTARVPGIYNNGIDISNPSAPVVNQKTVEGLGAGRYTLFVTIDGKTRKVQTFTPAGELDVVYGNAVSKYIDDEDSKNDKDLGTYQLVTSEMGGKLVPVYVSNVGPYEDNLLLVQPSLAVGMSYALAFDPLMQVYYKNEAGDLVRIYAGDTRTIGESGVDTLWATVEMDDLTQPLTEFTIGVAGRPNAMHVSFYLPVISFVSAPDSTATQVTGQQPEADGTYEEHWVGTLYDLYLAILKPMTDASGSVKYYPCKEDCEGLLIHKGAETSPKVDFIPEQIAFHDGYATVQVRSMTKYRWDEDATKCNPAYIVAEYNDYVKAVYTPMYFRDPPVPYPVLADVFDAHGALPTDAYKIPEPYFSENKEYLDGIGDSVAIYYDRKIHKDSIPTMMCILWDDTTTVEDIETLRHNPVAEGFSNIPKDTAIFCNALVGTANINVDCSNPVEYNGKGGYCTNVAMIGGVTLSEKVKTQGVGKVHSYAVFEDKGRQVKQGFIGALTDRIAPVPLRAEVRSLRNGDEVTEYDSLVVIFSEPVKLLTTTSKKSALDFYLNSAVELPEDQRYTSALGNSSSVVTAESDPSIGTEFNESENRTEGRVKFMYKRGNVSPHVGDYLRMGGTLAEVFWSDADTTHTSQPGSDTLRAVADASYAWNSPTSYDETKRIPSPWIPVIGDAEIDVIENKFASTANVGAGDMPAITVNSYRTTMTKAEILAKENGRPGQLVKADMYALYNGLSAEEKASIDINDMYFFYEVQYFTNLGGYVASKSQRIYCNDAKNKELYNEEYFGGATCIDAGGDRNFYIGWNMRSDKGRVVGTGAYIMKLKSYVRLGDVGKDAKQESTSVYGVKRSPKEYTGWKADAASESK